MPKRSSIEVSQIAEVLINETAGLDLRGKNPAAVALGRRGGLKGGKARAEMLSANERSEIARKAALARWKSKMSEAD